MLGFIFILASVILQAFALSRVSFQFSSGEVMIFSTTSFFLCSIFFLCKLVATKKLNLTKEKVLSLAKMNLYTFLAFFSFHLALTYIPASSAALFESAVAVVVVSVVTREALGRLAQAFTIALLTLLFAIKANVMDAALLLGLVLAALAGIGAALISLKSNAKFMGDLSIDEILAFRFLLSGIAAMGVIFSTGARLGGEVGLAEVAGLSVFGFVLPFFLLQKGMEITKPVLTVCMLSVIPAISYLFESALYSEPSIQEVMLISSSVAFIVWFSIADIIKTRTKPVSVET